MAYKGFRRDMARKAAKGGARTAKQIAAQHKAAKVSAALRHMRAAPQAQITHAYSRSPGTLVRTGAPRRNPAAYHAKRATQRLAATKRVTAGGRTGYDEDGFRTDLPGGFHSRRRRLAARRFAQDMSGDQQDPAYRPPWM
jgi:hypothetical protein